MYTHISNGWKKIQTLTLAHKFDDSNIVIFNECE